MTVHNGTLHITKDGTLLDRMEVRGMVVVDAANVTIRNSWIRGDSGGTERGALISNYSSRPNLVVEDTKVQEMTPSVTHTAGVAGGNFRLTRVTVSGQIDSVNITGSNVTVEDSTLKDTVRYASDVNQRGGPSHSDNVQILRGDDIKIRGNTITGSQNFAVLGAPESGSMNNLVVENNYVDNGWCTMKFSSKGGNPHSIRVSDNTFGGHSSQRCDLVAETYQGAALNLSTSGNVFSDGRPVPITR